MCIISCGPSGQSSSRCFLKEPLYPKVPLGRGLPLPKPLPGETQIDYPALLGVHRRVCIFWGPTCSETKPQKSWQWWPRGSKMPPKWSPKWDQEGHEWGLGGNLHPKRQISNPYTIYYTLGTSGISKSSHFEGLGSHNGAKKHQKSTVSKKHPNLPQNLGFCSKREPTMD